MKPLLFAFDADKALVERLCEAKELELGGLERRRFPDGETYLRFETPVASRDVVFLCSLDRPDSKALPLLFAADAVRKLGATKVGLVAPYLPYMRQDKAFRDGEAVSSVTFARLLSAALDWLVTVDPHLHRYRNLSDLYSIRSITASASGPIAAWLRDNIECPVLFGPDEESGQWVTRIAEQAGVPAALFRKRRTGDYEISLDGADVLLPPSSTPVLVDDIASSGRTMAQAVRMLREAGHSPPICIVVHAIFAEDAYEHILAAGPAAIMSTNTIAHHSNRIDVAPEIVAAIDAACEASGFESFG